MEGAMRVSHETAHRILMGGSILMFLLAILGAVGEYLGWWNLVGEVLMTVGTLGGLVLAGVDFLRGASETQVESVQSQLGSMDTKLDRLEPMDGKLESMDSKLDRLDVIEAALIDEDEQISKLDVGQAELDRQTGVLGRQVQLLGEIRDGL